MPLGARPLPSLPPPSWPMDELVNVAVWATPHSICGCACGCCSLDQTGRRLLNEEFHDHSFVVSLFKIISGCCLKPTCILVSCSSLVILGGNPAREMLLRPGIGVQIQKVSWGRKLSTPQCYSSDKHLQSSWKLDICNSGSVAPN